MVFDGQVGMQAELDLATAEIERAQQRLLALEQEKAGLMDGAERSGGGHGGSSKPRDQQSHAAEEAVRAELSTQVHHVPSGFRSITPLVHTRQPMLYSLSCICVYAL